MPESDSYRRLLLSFPDLKVSHDGRDVVDALVEGTALELTNEKGIRAILSAGDVLGRLRDAVGLDYEEAEVQAALERLNQRGAVLVLGGNGRAFRLSDKRVNDLRSQSNQQAEVGEEARTAFADLAAGYTSLARSQIDDLWEAFDSFVNRIVHYHAAEAASFLYAGDDAGQIRFYNTLTAHPPTLGDEFDPAVAAAARQLFNELLTSPPPAILGFLAQRLEAAFFFHLLSIDPTASELARESLAKKTLYLDTNYLHRLVGLDGPVQAYLPMYLMQKSNELGANLVVAQATVSEFTRLLRAEVSQVRRQPITRAAYQKVAAEHSGSEWSFAQAYYRELQAGQVETPDEFELKYLQLRPHLEQWNITIDEEARLSDQVRRSDDFRDRCSELSKWHGGNRSPESLEHDAFLSLYIRNLRGDVDESPRQVEYWFLTVDKKLTKFAAHYATASHIPFALLASDWLQIVRAFFPRTEDYETSFLSMLEAPLLYQQDSVIPFEHVTGALERLERYRELPIEVVAGMVADGEFLRRLSAAGSEAEERDLIELEVQQLASKVSEQNQELREQLESLRIEVNSLRKAGSEKDDQIRRMVQERGEKEDEIAQLQVSTASALSSVQKEADAHRQDRARSEGRIDSLESRLDRLQVLLWVGLFFYLPLALAAALWIPGVWSRFASVQRTILIVAGIVSLSGPPLILSGKKGWAGFAILVSIAGFVVSCLSAFLHAS